MRFRDNPALYACHTNTDNLHIHVLVTARDTEGRKLDLSDRQYKSFDKAGAKIEGMNRDDDGWSR